MSSEFFIHHLKASPVIAILRGLTVDETVELALRCWDHGIRLVEVPTQSESAYRALEAAAEHANTTERILGAGSICSSEDVTRAHESGAQFLVSPGLFPDSIRTAQALGLPYLPGVMTPTDVYGALTMSLTVQKLFPSDVIGSAGLRTLRGPFPSAQFVAVGGISPDNAQQYFDAGAVGIGVANALRAPDTLAQFASLTSPIT